MATVFLARDLKHGRQVALKVLHPGLAAVMGTDRFLREIEIAANLNHPHILPVLDSGLAGDLPFYAMPFVDGESLRQRMDREGRLPFAEVIRLSREIASALDASHRHGLIHRDIKPENVLLNQGHAVVTDFGIARATTSAENLTATGMSLGTPSYMSPEQATGERDIDGRSDQYALACVVYEMLSGSPPFKGKSIIQIIARHATDPVPILKSVDRDLPDQLQPALAKALAKRPDDRFETVGEFVDSLSGHGEVPVVATGPTSASSARRPWIVAAMVAALAVAGFLLTRGRGPDSAVAPSAPIPVAVLPLETRGTDSLYFAEGLSDEISTRLTRVLAIAVMGRNTAAQPTDGNPVDLKEIGERLKVDYVLTGSVQWTESNGVRRVAVRPSLVRVRDGKVVWGEVYTNALDDLFAVQAAVAQQVVAALEIELGAGERQAIAAAPTTSRDAWALYSLGRFDWKKRTAQGLKDAVTQFQRAIELDPKFARAHAGLADSYVLFSQFGVTDLTREEGYRRARAAAIAALTLDSTLAEAHNSLAEVIMYVDRDWKTSESHFKRAIALDSTYPTAFQWYAELLAVVGRADSALVVGRRAAALDPGTALVVHAHALALRALHRFAEAVPVYRRTLEIDPAFGYGQFGLLLSLIGAGDETAAFDQLARMGLGTDLHRAWVGAAIDSARAPAARRVIAANKATVEAMGPAAEAMIQTSVLNRDRAIELLTQIVNDKGAVLPALMFAEFDRLRGDPRFVELVRRMDFVHSAPP
jgi:serine/threonine-protein kinase